MVTTRKNHKTRLWPAICIAFAAILVLPAHTARAEDRVWYFAFRAASTDGGASLTMCRGHLLAHVLVVTDDSRRPWARTSAKLICEQESDDLMREVVRVFPDTCGEVIFDRAGVIVIHDHVRGMGYQQFGIVIPPRWLFVAACGLF